jgi:hypothetical protein
MSKTPALSILMIAVLGCGGGGSDPDAGGDDDVPDARFDAPPGTPTDVTLTVLGLDGLPDTGAEIVLVSDNGGPFTPVTGTGGVYRASVVGPRYAFARGCRDAVNQYAEGYIFYLTLDDTTDVRDVGCHFDFPTVLLSGTMTGILPTQRGALVTEFATSTFTAGATDYSMGVPPGTTDLFGRLFPAVPTTEPRPTERLYIERDVAVPGDTIHDVDFGLGGVDPDTFAITVSNAGAGTQRVFSSLRTGGLFNFTMETTLLVANEYHTFPAALMQPGELITVSRTTVSGDSSLRAAVTLATPTNIATMYGDPYTPAPPTLAAPGRLTGQLPHADGAGLYTVDAFVFDDVTFDATYWAQQYTARYAGDAPIDFTFPDLTGIGGWDIALIPGRIDWSQTAASSDHRTLVPGFPGAPPVDGDYETTATLSGAIEP